MNGTTDEAAVERAHPPPSVSLDGCTASELAKHLLEDRFEGDAMATTTFLLECTQTLPDADTISAEIMGSTGAEEEEDGAEEEQVEAVAAVSHDSDDGAEGRDDDDAAQDDGEDADDDDDDDDGSILTLPGTAGAASATVEVSATVPRGKFDLTARRGGGGLTLRNKKDERIAVPSRAVARVVLFPRPEECRRPTSGRAKKGGPTRPGHLVLIVLRTEEGGGDGDGGGGGGVVFRGKALEQVCFQLPRSTVPRRQPAAEGADGGDGGGRGGDGRSTDASSDPDDDEGAWASTLSQALDVERSQIAVVSNPAYSCDDSSPPSAAAAADGSAAPTTPPPPRYEFRSDATASTSTTTSGMPYVSCYRGVHDGALFPLREGLLFFKPPLFVPRSALVSISCGRGGGNSRYVDLVAVLEPEGKSKEEKDHGKDEDEEEEEGKVLEFTNIAREEVKVLNDYIQRVLVKAMEMDADAAGGDGKGGGGGGGGGGESSSTEEEEDDDDHGDAGSSAKAKATIRDEDGESDEDEEDDSDYAEGDGSYAEEDDATESDDDDDNNDDDDEDEECCIEESPPPPKKKARRG